MNYILFDSSDRDYLLPFTFTRPVADIRVGIMTLREKWEFFTGSKTSSLTRDYLQKKFPLKTEETNILINGAVFPTDHLVKKVKNLRKGEALFAGDIPVAACMGKDAVRGFPATYRKVECKEPVKHLKHIWEIFKLNTKEIIADFELLTQGRTSAALSPNNFVIGNPELIFIEEGAKVEYAFLNTTDGPVYLGKNSEVMEGAKIRGPFALCEHSVVKLDAKIYPGTTIGPWSKVGGEVSNSVIFGYSNKAHDGFLGNSVLGEWCNLGADTNVSNLKNTYEEVKLWSYPEKKFVKTGEQFCGLMMGDHSKTGINTMFNTGTVAGVNANIFGDGYQRNFIPSFSWGGPVEYRKFLLRKAFQVADAVFKRRNRVFDDIEKEILAHIYEHETSSGNFS